MSTRTARKHSSSSYRSVLLCVILLTTFFSVKALASSPLQIVEEEFIGDITAGWKSFEVCEYHSPGENRALFFARALNLKPTTAGKVIETKEIVVRESGGGRGFHLGIVELEFPTIELAERVHNPQAASKKQFFSGTKILSRYVSLRRDRRVLIVYSETHTNAKVNHFLEQLGSLGSRLWGDR